jgi:hypothetical protein
LPSDIPSRFKGKQMSRGERSAHALHGRRGMDIDGASVVQSIHAGDPYVDPGGHERRAAVEALAKRGDEEFYVAAHASDQPFSTYANVDEGDDSVKPRPERKDGKVITAPPGVLVAPVKKGCAGTPGITIGGEFEGMPEEYQPSKRLNAKAVKRAKARMKERGNPPWGAGGAGSAKGRSFDEKGALTRYEPGAWAERSRKSREERAEEAAALKERHPDPFFPPNRNGRGKPEVFAHVSEPADARTGRERRDAAAAAFARTKEYFPLGAPSGPKSTPVSTISKYDRGTWSAPTSLRETQLIK